MILKMSFLQNVNFRISLSEHFFELFEHFFELFEHSLIRYN